MKPEHPSATYAPGQKESATAGDPKALNRMDSAQLSEIEDRQPANDVQATSSVEAALALSRAKRSAIPVNGKKPLVAWQSFQTVVTDRVLIEGWFKKYPHAGVAHIMGRGVFVLDIDNKPGRVGDESLAALEAKHGKLPDTYSVTTPSGGRHFYFRVPDEMRTRNGTDNIGSGIDVRGDGGFVVAPPSLTEAGAYVEDHPGRDYAMAPDWLIALVRADGERMASATPGQVTQEHVTRQQIADLAGALHFLDSDNYDQWIAAGQALRALGDDGLRLWGEFSARSGKFSQADCLKRWETFTGERTGYQSIFKQAQANGWANPRSGKSSFVPVLDGKPDGGFIWGDVLTDPARMKPMEWTVRKLIPAECTGLIFGAWGTCKTFVALDFACCIANGMDWHGHKTKQGTVFYLCGEGESGIAYRLKAWQTEYEGSTRAIAVKTMPDIRDAATLEYLMIRIERLAAERGAPRLILIDTLFTALNGGDENSGKDMGAVFSSMRALRQRFGCAVIAVHHTGKKGEDPRGHSSMAAGVDVQFHLKAKDGPDGVIFLEMENAKQKDGNRHQNILLVSPVIRMPDLPDEDGEASTSRIIQTPGEQLIERSESIWALSAESGPKVNKQKLAEMQQRAVDLKAAGHTLRQISEAIKAMFGEDKSASVIRAWLNKRGIDTGRDP